MGAVVAPSCWCRWQSLLSTEMSTMALVEEFEQILVGNLHMIFKV